jgi:dihydroflavonol-4-reductase
MNIAVTGASGHVGANLCRFLLEEGHHVRGIVHKDERALTGIAVERVKADLTDPDSLAAAFKNTDYVFHLAALISLEKKDVSLMETINITGSKNVIDACFKTGVTRLIHCSSIEALLTPPNNNATTEESPLMTKDRCIGYDWTKAESERRIMEAAGKGLDAVIINPTAVVGPYDFKPSFFGRVLISLFKGTLPALVNGGYNWVDVRDVAAGALAAARHGKAGERYILHGHWLSLEDLARMIGTRYGISTPRFVCPLPLAQAGITLGYLCSRLFKINMLYNPGMLRAIRTHRNIETDKAKRDLGYSSRPLEVTMHDTIEWFIAQGYLEYQK